MNIPVEIILQKSPLIKSLWHFISVVTNAAIGRIGLFLLTLSLIFLGGVVWSFIRYLLERWKKDAIRQHEFLYSMKRNMKRFFYFLVPGLLLFGFASLIGFNFVNFHGVQLIEFGEMTITNPSNDTFHVILSPVSNNGKHIKFRGKGRRLYLVGFFVDCPSWMRWVLYSSRFTFLGFEVSKSFMDFPTETRLMNEWKPKLSLGARTLMFFSNTFHVCKAHIQSSLTLKHKNSRYLVFVTPKGFILQNVPFLPAKKR